MLDLEWQDTQLGTDVDGLVVNIVIRAVAGAELASLTQAAGEQGMKLLSNAIEFRLLVSGGGQELEMTDFGGVYMVKSIVLDEGLAERNVMAVLYDSESRTFTFVPTVADTTRQCDNTNRRHAGPSHRDRRFRVLCAHGQLVHSCTAYSGSDTSWIA